MASNDLDSLDSTDTEADDNPTAAGVASMISGGGDAGFDVADDDEPGRKSGAVALLVLVLGAGGLGLLFWKGGPRLASASEDAAGAQVTVSTFLASGPSSLTKMTSMLDDTETLVAQFERHTDRTQVPLDSLQTNPFRTLIKKAEAVSTTPDVRAVSLRQQELARQAALDEAKRLNLQTVMYSENGSSCMIDNRLLRTGDTIGQFIIEQIHPGTVVVRSGSYRFQLAMRQ